jgi:succinate dehydrogenase/fumarate reductase cytochrome b subunit
MALFLGPHIGMAVVGGSSGPHGFDGALGGLRTFYQAPHAEAVMLAGGCVHATVSLWRLARRSARMDAAAAATETATGGNASDIEKRRSRRITSPEKSASLSPLRALWTSVRLELSRAAHVFRPHDATWQTQQARLGAATASADPLPLSRSQGAVRALHRVSGYVLVAFVGLHVAVVRGTHVLLGHPVADFSLITFSLKTWPWLFYPYYWLLATSGAVHLLCGVPLAMKAIARPASLASIVPRVPSRQTVVGGLLFTGVGISIALLRFGGWWGTGIASTTWKAWRGPYEALFDRCVPFPSLKPYALPWTSTLLD